jgi:parvulin-like peptidyl-prolyl isomerase
VVFNLDSGEVAKEPIRTHVGWHILRSEGKRTAEDGTEEVHVFQILKKFKPSGDTFSEVYSLAGQFLDAAKNTTFEETTALKGLEIISSGRFVEGNYCGKMGQSQEANDFAFSAKQGEISRPFMIANTKDQEYKIVVTRLKGLTPAGTLTLEDAYSYADSRLKQEKTMQRAYELAQKVYDKSEIDFMLKDAAEEFEGVEFHESEFFTRSEVRATKLGNDPQFMGAAFGLSLGEKNLSEPVYTGRGVAVIMITGRVFNADEFELVKDNIYNQLWAQKVNVTIQAWSDNLMNEAVIEDFRDMRVKWSF